MVDPTLMIDPTPLVKSICIVYTVPKVDARTNGTPHTQDRPLTIERNPHNVFCIAFDAGPKTLLLV